MKNTINNINESTLQRKVAAMQQERHSGLPIWIRAPKQGGLDRYCGLSRSKLYQLSGKNLIKSVSLREAHQIRGVRLFNLQSILTYINSMADLPECKEVDREAVR